MQAQPAVGLIGEACACSKFTATDRARVGDVSRFVEEYVTPMVYGDPAGLPKLRDVTLQHLLCTMSRAKLPRCAADMFAFSMITDSIQNLPSCWAL